MWTRCLYEENPGATDGRGLASSPVIADDSVVVQVDTQNASFAAGIDLTTGADRWRVERPREISWATPTVLTAWGPTGGDLVLLQGGTRLSAFDPRTGKEAWYLERKSHPISSSLLHGGVLYVPGAEGGLAAMEKQPGGAPPKVLWEQPRLNPGTASPVVLDGKLYVLRQSVLNVGEPMTGAAAGTLRLRGSQFSASLVAAGGLIYVVGEDGLVQVVKPGEKDPTVAGSGSVGETILATPAVVDGALYLRSDRHLWKFAK